MGSCFCEARGVHPQRENWKFWRLRQQPEGNHSHDNTLPGRWGRVHNDGSDREALSTEEQEHDIQKQEAVLVIRITIQDDIKCQKLINGTLVIVITLMLINHFTLYLIIITLVTGKYGTLVL